MSKLKNSISGIFIGIIIMIIGTILLWWNEGNNVKNIKTTKELDNKVVDIKSDKIDKKNNGKLIATNGKLDIKDDALEDFQFGVSIKTSKLSRIVEVYQWQEETNSDNNKKEYKKVWSKELINSSNFKNNEYSNPTSIPYDSKDYIAENVYIGVFKLRASQVSSIITNKELKLESDMKLPANYKISGNYITNSEDVKNPKIGDMRIYYLYNDYKDASVIGLQQDESILPYISKAGKETFKIVEGELSGSQIVSIIRKENKVIKWLFRLIGSLLIIFGYISLLGPLTTLTSFVPILGKLAGNILNTVGSLFGIAHSLLVIAISWIFYRPGLGILLICLVLIINILLSKIIRTNKQKTNNNIMRN